MLKIKNRGGKLINGIWVKEENLWFQSIEEYYMKYMQNWTIVVDVFAAILKEML